MSIIRYKYKADRDFESVQFEGMACAFGDLKRMIFDRSSRSGTHRPRDEYDLTISNATTHEGLWALKFILTTHLFFIIYRVQRLSRNDSSQHNCGRCSTYSRCIRNVDRLNQPETCGVIGWYCQSVSFIDDESDFETTCLGCLLQISSTCHPSHWTQRKCHCLNERWSLVTSTNTCVSLLRSSLD